MKKSLIIMMLAMVAITASAKDIKTDIEAQKVFVTYDAAKTTEKKLQDSFQKFGYKAVKTTKDAKVAVHEDESCDNM